MAKWEYKQVLPVNVPYIRIHCFTHKKDVTKSSLRTSHKGCDVQYVDKDGKPQD